MSDILSGAMLSLNELNQRSTYTPDLRDLEEYEYHLIFIFDYLKKGFQGYKFHLDKPHIKFMGNAQSFASDYTARMTPQVPLVFLNPKEESFTKKVFGEVYAVHPQDIVRLDNLYENNVNKKRIKRHFKLMDQSYKTKDSESAHPIMEAWVYISEPFLRPLTINYCPMINIQGKDLCFYWHNNTRVDMD